MALEVVALKRPAHIPAQASRQQRRHDGRTQQQLET